MKLESNITLTLLALAATAAVGSAQTITVTTSANAVDVGSTAMIADLPGPDGLVSFREALLVSDNEPGRQTVGFAIPEHDWPTLGVDDGQVLVESGTSFAAFDTVTIDGTTQTAFTGDTYPGGWEIIISRGVNLSGDESEAFGTHGTNFALEGDNGLIRDNTGKGEFTIAFSTGNLIRDNEGEEVDIWYASGNTVIRNVLERVRIIGLNESEPAVGNVIGGPDPADRNYITGWGNVGEHGSVAGTTVDLYNTDQTLIQNNWIGTTPDGMSIGNNASTTGIGVYNRNHNLMVRDNLIAISAHWGGGTSGPAHGSPIELNCYLGGSGIEIYGNTLGLNALGEPLLGGAYGIYVSKYVGQYGAQVRIGGPNPGEANIIAGHEGAGILMPNSSGIVALGKIRVSGNSIHSNGDIGIDLMPNTWDLGPTPNDPLDADTIGANRLQNFPDLMLATPGRTGLRVAGGLHSTPLKNYTVEFFATPTCDISGYGPGEVFLGSASVTTDGDGNALFDVELSAKAPVGWVVTSTATREPGGRTSEFSACVRIRNNSAGLTHRPPVGHP